MFEKFGIALISSIDMFEYSTSNAGTRKTSLVDLMQGDLQTSTIGCYFQEPRHSIELTTSRACRRIQPSLTSDYSADVTNVFSLSMILLRAYS